MAKPGQSCAKRPRSRMAAAGWLALAALGCGKPAPGPEAKGPPGQVAPAAVASPALPPAASVPPTLTRASWRLTWQGAGQKRSGGGWSVQTRDGTVVHIDKGHLLTWSVALQRCPGVQPVRPAQGRWHSWLVAEALANHGAAPEPAQALVHLQEDLALLQDQDAAALTFPAQATCGVHWLVAQKREDAGVPAQGQPARHSLWLQGRWQRGAAAGVWSAETWLPSAMLQPLGQLNPQAAGVQVVIERDLTGWFDGLDLEHATPQALGWELLSRLTTRAKVRVTASTAP